MQTTVLEQKGFKEGTRQKFQPTWEQIWNTGYTRPTGTFKEGIFKKLSDSDKKKLEEVKSEERCNWFYRWMI